MTTFSIFSALSDAGHRQRGGRHSLPELAWFPDHFARLGLARQFGKLLCQRVEIGSLGSRGGRRRLGLCEGDRMKEGSAKMVVMTRLPDGKI